MLTAIEGIYEDGQVILKEKPAFNKRVTVFVMFIEERVESITAPKQPSKSLRGAWKNVNDVEKQEIEQYFENVRNEWERDI